MIVRNGQIAGTFLDIRDRVLDDGERGLLSVAFDPGYAQNHLFYVDYTDQNGDTPRRRVHRGERRRRPVDRARSSGREAAVPEPQGRPARSSTAAGFLYVGFGDGGTDPAAGDVSTGDPQNHAQNLAQPARQAAAHQAERAGRGVADRRARAAQPVALLVRPARPATSGSATSVQAAPRRSTSGRARRSERSRTTAGAASKARRSTTRRSALSKKGVLRRRRSGRTRTTAAARHRRLRLPRRASGARGRYFFGDFCDGSLWSFKVGPKGRASTVTRLPQEIPNLSSFGEDANGGLYAVSLDGGLYQLR